MYILGKTYFTWLKSSYLLQVKHWLGLTQPHVWPEVSLKVQFSGTLLEIADFLQLYYFIGNLTEKSAMMGGWWELSWTCMHKFFFTQISDLWRFLSWLLLWSGSRIIVAHTHTHTESSLKCCGQSSHPPSLSGWKPAERHMRASPRPSAVNLQTSVVAAARNVTYRSHCVNTELNIDAGFLSFTVPLLSDPSHLSLTDGYLFCLPSKNISTII